MFKVWLSYINFGKVFIILTLHKDTRGIVCTKETHYWFKFVYFLLPKFNCFCLV